jgi:hypothetical protein
MYRYFNKLPRVQNVRLIYRHNNSGNIAKYNFAPASSRDSLVYGAERPGAASEYDKPDAISVDIIHDWANFMKENKIKRVISLLNDDEYNFFQSPGYEATLKSLGFEVTAVNVFNKDALGLLIKSFESVSKNSEKVVVHCSGGQGRTGVVLSLWLMLKYNLNAENAAKEIVDHAKLLNVSRQPKVDKVTDFVERGTLGKK